MYETEYMTIWSMINCSVRRPISSAPKTVLNAKIKAVRIRHTACWSRNVGLFLLRIIYERMSSLTQGKRLLFNALLDSSKFFSSNFAESQNVCTQR